VKTVYKLLRAGMHSLLLFALPWVVGAVTGAFFDISEVRQTGATLTKIFAYLMVPLVLIQLVGIGVKVARERRVLRADGVVGFPAFVEALDRHVRLLTGRGMGLLAATLLLVFVTLSAEWAQFGVLTVVGLGLVYLAATAATIVSAFGVRAFDDRVLRAGGRIEREMSPPLVEAGEAVDERFYLSRVPVPPGFRLVIQDALPARVGGESRFVADRAISLGSATISAPLPRTPRGVFRMGPATVWYEDVLGLTRVRVASRACASLRVLPRLRPILFEQPPRAMLQAEGRFSRLARLATEERYGVRPYTPGDDRRRMHWKLSIKTGTMQVRVPEAVPYARRKVRLLLDSFLPVSAEPASALLGDALDLLVEGWIALAHALTKRGEQVTLVTAMPDGSVREVSCRSAEERVWRAIGAEVAWQSRLGPRDILARAPAGAASAILVTGGLSDLPSVPAGTSVALVDIASLLEKPAADRRSWAERYLLYTYPPGADDNGGSVLRWLRNRRRKKDPRGPLEELARQGAARTLGAARGAGAAVLQLRRRGVAITLEAVR
jgi:uncharacterized protein (DUF58 family)